MPSPAHESFAPVFLLKDQERRLLAGHCWVFSNEIDTKRTALKELSAGQTVSVIAQNGRWIGYGYINPHSLISVRLLSTEKNQTPSVGLLRQRLAQALAWRSAFYTRPFYRLVHGEGDGLPGLIIDRFDTQLVMQITTAGMEAWRTEIVQILDDLLAPTTIILRNDIASRELEGLTVGIETIKDSAQPITSLEENGLHYETSLLEGQKTGWFYDQAMNRKMLSMMPLGAKVLDVCAYQGAWGITAAATGAKEVICIDSSMTAIAGIQRNAVLNGLSDRVEAKQADAFEELKRLADAGAQFDTVILDPPAFIKRKRDLKNGTLAYQRLNSLGLKLVRPSGLLITSSCSYHMPVELFRKTVLQGANKVNKHLQILTNGQQGPDHPIHPAIPETAYLKTLFLRVIA